MDVCMQLRECAITRERERDVPTPTLWMSYCMSMRWEGYHRTEEGTVCPLVSNWKIRIAQRRLETRRHSS